MTRGKKLALMLQRQLLGKFIGVEAIRHPLDHIFQAGQQAVQFLVITLSPCRLIAKNYPLLDNLPTPNPRKCGGQHSRRVSHPRPILSQRAKLYSQLTRR